MKDADLTKLTDPELEALNVEWGAIRVQAREKQVSIQAELDRRHHERKHDAYIEKLSPAERAALAERLAKVQTVSAATVDSGADVKKTG